MFQDLGFYKDYYVNNKFVGSLECEKDREEMGYNGRKTEVLTETITFKNKKVIKENTQVMTYLYPLCGKLSK